MGHLEQGEMSGTSLRQRFRSRKMAGGAHVNVEVPELFILPRKEKSVNGV